MNTNSNLPQEAYRGRGSRAGGGIVLIVLGLIFLAVTQGMFNFDWNNIWPGFNLNWGQIWPIFPFGVGVALLLGAAISRDPDARPHLLRSGTVLVLLGVFFFAAMWQFVSWALWPLLLIVAGIVLLFQPRTRHLGG